MTKTTYQKVKEDIITLMKKRDPNSAHIIGALRLVVGKMEYIATQKMEPVSEEIAIKAIVQETSEIEATIEVYNNILATATNEETLEMAKAQQALEQNKLAFLEEYLPDRYSEQELTNLVKGAIGKAGTKMGDIMKQVRIDATANKRLLNMADVATEVAKQLKGGK